MQLAAVSLSDVITPQTVAVVVASDVRVVLDIVESTAEDYSAWEADRQQQQHLDAGGTKLLAKHSMAYMQPAVAYNVWKSKAAQHNPRADSSSCRSLGSSQQQTEQACELCPVAGTPAAGRPAPASAADNVLQQRGAAVAQAPHAGLQVDAQHQQHGPAAAPSPTPAASAAAAHTPAVVHQQQQQQPASTGSSAPSSRRTTTEHSSFRGVALPLKALSARSLLAALPASLGSAAAGAGHEGAAHSRQRRQRGAIQVNTRCTASLGDAIGGLDKEESFVKAAGLKDHAVCVPM